MLIPLEWRDKEAYDGTKRFTPRKPLKISRWVCKILNGLSISRPEKVPNRPWGIERRFTA
jgi:hypothetical protein